MSTRPSAFKGSKGTLTAKANAHKKPRLSSEHQKPGKQVKKAVHVHPKAKPRPSDEQVAPSLFTSQKSKGKERELPPKASLKPAKAKTPAAASAPPPLPSSFKLVFGSYEKLLYGLEGSVTLEGTEYAIHLKPLFIFPAHVSCIKAVAASPHGGKWLATGSADEIIKVWDLRRQKEIGGLMHHEGSVTHLSFPSRSHLLSASEDGTLCLFRARDWAVLRSLKGHKGRVNSVAVHHSCKVALSVGKDRTLRMWDLMRGKGSASIKIGKEGELVRWSTDGTLFAVQTGSTIDLYSTDMQLLHSITHPSRLHDIRFCTRLDGGGEVLLAAAEDKKVSVYDLPSGKSITPTIVAEFVGATNRVKAVDTIRVSLPTGAKRSETTFVATISSDGKARVYDMATLPSSATAATSGEKGVTQLEPLAEYDTKGTRLTCLTLADGDVDSPNATGKRKRAQDDHDDAESGGDDAEDAWQDENSASGSGSEGLEGEDEEEEEEEAEGED